MASAKELREQISKNREALKQAIEGSGAKWETAPGGDEWSPRRVAEHAIGGEAGYASRAAAILGGNPVARIEYAFSTPQEAIEAMAKMGPDADKRFSWAEDRDLSKSGGGETLESIFQSAANHLQEHADQINAAS